MTKVLIHYHHRPMSVGVMIRAGFRKLGCDVKTIGPDENFVYGHGGWEDYEAPDFVTPNNQQPMSVNEALDIAKAGGFIPDAVVGCDQYDYAHLCGASRDKIPFIYIVVENYDPLQRSRYEIRKADAEFHFIAHSHPQLVPPESEWVAFGADTDIHPMLNLERDKWTCQIGSPYEPRPSVWNQLRARFDGAPYMGDYSRELIESEHTIFGKVFTYKGMAEAYNRSLTALSCSNVDFVPMRIAEAFAMGSILLSDDVPSMRHFFGTPYPDDSSGIWIAYDRSVEDMAKKIEFVRDMPVPERASLVRRAYSTMLEHFQYKHIAQRALEKVGLC